MTIKKSRIINHQNKIKPFTGVFWHILSCYQCMSLILRIACQNDFSCSSYFWKKKHLLRLERVMREAIIQQSFIWTSPSIFEGMVWLLREWLRFGLVGTGGRPGWLGQPPPPPSFTRRAWTSSYQQYDSIHNLSRCDQCNTMFKTNWSLIWQKKCFYHCFSR